MFETKEAKPRTRVQQVYDAIGELIIALASTNIEPSELILVDHSLRAEIRQGIVAHIVSIRMSGESLASVGHFPRERELAAHVIANLPTGVVGKGQGENNLGLFRDSAAGGKAIQSK